MGTYTSFYDREGNDDTTWDCSKHVGDALTLPLLEGGSYHQIIVGGEVYKRPTSPGDWLLDMMTNESTNWDRWLDMAQRFRREQFMGRG